MGAAGALVHCAWRARHADGCMHIAFVLKERIHVQSVRATRNQSTEGSHEKREKHKHRRDSLFGAGGGDEVAGWGADADAAGGGLQLVITVCGVAVTRCARQWE